MIHKECFPQYDSMSNQCLLHTAGIFPEDVLTPEKLVFILFSFDVTVAGGSLVGSCRKKQSSQNQRQTDALL